MTGREPDGAPGGENLLIDPLALSEEDAAEIERLGGVDWIVVTNRDHERETRAAAARFGARVAASAPEAALIGVPVQRTLAGGDEICGARVIELEGMKSPLEIALAWDRLGTVLTGDALWGAPAGALSLPPRLGDPATAVLSLRKLRARRPRHLLVGDGAPVFHRAYEAINELLEQRAEALAARINMDEVAFDPPDPRDPAGYASRAGEIGYVLGASMLGYQAAVVPPGQSVCPAHWHVVEEELFIVWRGTPLLRTPQRETRLRPGDLVNFPRGAQGTHKLTNDTDADCIVIMIAGAAGHDVCFYPDSEKLLVYPQGVIVRTVPHLEYFDGET